MERKENSNFNELNKMAATYGAIEGQLLRTIVVPVPIITKWNECPISKLKLKGPLICP
jgi:hypothetical protein